MAPTVVTPNQCLTCINEPKLGTDYPCSACRCGDKWVKKKEQDPPRRTPLGLILDGPPQQEAPERDCSNCCYEGKEVDEKPCSTCVDSGNWLPVEMFNASENAKREHDPLDTDAHAPGAKLDAGKVLAGVLADFSLALLAVAEVGTHGAEKYSRGGWQSVPEGETRYKDADWRRLLKGRHEDFDIDSGLLHEAHRAWAWNVLAALELRLRREKGK